MGCRLSGPWMNDGTMGVSAQDLRYIQNHEALRILTGYEQPITVQIEGRRGRSLQYHRPSDSSTQTERPWDNTTTNRPCYSHMTVPGSNHGDGGRYEYLPNTPRDLEDMRTSSRHDPEFSPKASEKHNCLLSCCSSNMDEPNSFQSQTEDEDYVMENTVGYLPLHHELDSGLGWTDGSFHQGELSGVETEEGLDECHTHQGGRAARVRGGSPSSESFISSELSDSGFYSVSTAEFLRFQRLLEKRMRVYNSRLHHQGELQNLCMDTQKAHRELEAIPEALATQPDSECVETETHPHQMVRVASMQLRKNERSNLNHHSSSSAAIFSTCSSPSGQQRVTPCNTTTTGMLRRSRTLHHRPVHVEQRRRASHPASPNYCSVTLNCYGHALQQQLHEKTKADVLYNAKYHTCHANQPVHHANHPTHYASHATNRANHITHHVNHPTHHASYPSHQANHPSHHGHLTNFTSLHANHPAPAMPHTNHPTHMANQAAHLANITNPTRHVPHPPHPYHATLPAQHTHAFSSHSPHHDHAQTSLPTQHTHHDQAHTTLPTKQTHHDHSHTTHTAQHTHHDHSNTTIPAQHTHHDHSPTTLPAQHTHHDHSPTSLPAQHTHHDHSPTTLPAQHTHHDHAHTTLPSQHTHHDHAHTTLPAQHSHHDHSPTMLPAQHPHHDHSHMALPAQHPHHDHSHMALPAQHPHHDHTHTIVPTQHAHHDHTHANLTASYTHHDHVHTSLPVQHTLQGNNSPHITHHTHMNLPTQHAHHSHDALTLHSPHHGHAHTMLPHQHSHNANDTPVSHGTQQGHGHTTLTAQDTHHSHSHTTLSSQGTHHGHTRTILPPRAPLQTHATLPTQQAHHMSRIRPKHAISQPSLSSSTDDHHFALPKEPCCNDRGRSFTEPPTVGKVEGEKETSGERERYHTLSHTPSQEGNETWPKTTNRHGPYSTLEGHVTTTTSSASKPPVGPSNPRAIRNQLLRERAIRLADERSGGISTDDETNVEIRRVGRYWSRSERREQVLQKQRQKREALRGGGATSTTSMGGDSSGYSVLMEMSQRKLSRLRNRKLLDDWTTVEELLTHGTRLGTHDENIQVPNSLLTVTTV